MVKHKSVTCCPSFQTFFQCANLKQRLFAKIGKLLRCSTFAFHIHVCIIRANSFKKMDRGGNCRTHLPRFRFSDPLSSPISKPLPQLSIPMFLNGIALIIKMHAVGNQFIVYWSHWPVDLYTCIYPLVFLEDTLIHVICLHFCVVLNRRNPLLDPSWLTIYHGLSNGTRWVPGNDVTIEGLFPSDKSWGQDGSHILVQDGFQIILTNQQC